LGRIALDKLDIASRTERGLQGGVVHLVYMAALALGVGDSMYGLTEMAGRAENLLAAQEFNEDGTSMYRNARERMLGAGSGGDVTVDSGMSESKIRVQDAGLRGDTGNLEYAGYVWRLAAVCMEGG
jgi:hypothetical protein